MARIRAGLRSRAHVEGSDATSVVFGDYTLELGRRRLTRKGRPVRLTPTELKLLATLARHADAIVPIDALLKETWGDAHKEARRIRPRLHPRPAAEETLVNDTGFGYRLRASTETPAPSARSAG